MSAPGMQRQQRLNLPDFSFATRSKPVRILGYMLVLATVTMVGTGILLASIALMGLVGGTFNVSALF